MTYTVAIMLNLSTQIHSHALDEAQQKPGYTLQLKAI